MPPKFSSLIMICGSSYCGKFEFPSNFNMQVRTLRQPILTCVLHICFLVPSCSCNIQLPSLGMGFYFTHQHPYSWTPWDALPQCHILLATPCKFSYYFDSINHLNGWWFKPQAKNHNHTSNNGNEILSTWTLSIFFHTK
jgi:hypothetical protein